MATFVYKGIANSAIYVQGKGWPPGRFFVYIYIYIYIYLRKWDGDLLHGMGWPPPPFSIHI